MPRRVSLLDDIREILEDITYEYYADGESMADRVVALLDKASSLKELLEIAGDYKLCGETREDAAYTVLLALVEGEHAIERA